MNQPLKHLLICCLSCSLVFSCTSIKYTESIHKSLQAQPVPPSRIAVFPVVAVDYTKPKESTAYKSISFNPTYYWNIQIKKELTSNFPSQKWLFFDERSRFFKTQQHSLTNIYTLAQQNLHSFKNDHLFSNPIYYNNDIGKPELAKVLKDIHDSTNADYVIFFLQPKLSGEHHIDFIMNGNSMSGARGTTKRTFTADIRIQIWDCKNAHLMYCSGGWDKSDEGWSFTLPEAKSIINATRKIINNLGEIISLMHLVPLGPVAENHF